MTGVNTLAIPENPPLDVGRYNRLHPTFHKPVVMPILRRLFPPAARPVKRNLERSPTPDRSRRHGAACPGFPQVMEVNLFE